MKHIEDFETFIFPYAPDVPTSVLQHAIRESIANFMNSTYIAKDFAQFSLEPKTSDYVIPLPECRNILEVVEVALGPSGGVKDDTWTILHIGVDYELDIMSADNPNIILKWVPDETCHSKLKQDIHIEYSWSVKRDECDVPDFIYERFMPQITDGALAILYSIPSQEFTNLQYAAALRANLDVQYRRIKGQYRRRDAGPLKMRLQAPTKASRSFWRM